MTDIQEAKKMARALREALAAKSVTVSHSEALELVAKSLGCADWNTLAATTAGPEAGASAEPPAFLDAIPILRIFDVEKAKAFYVSVLGFKIDWEHRFEPGYPLFAQVSRGGLRLHLSEHYGDGTPGTNVYIYVAGLDALHAELKTRGSHAEIEPGPSPNMRVLPLWDPFGNRLRFTEILASAEASPPEGYRAPAS